MARTKQTGRKKSTGQLQRLTTCNIPRVAIATLSGRLSQDTALYARYQKGDLDSDLNISLKTSSLEQGVKVSKSALIELSALLGDMAAHAAESVLFIQELSGEQLKRLAAAIYGKPLRDTCSVTDVHALSHFAHKYDVPSLEPAIATLMPSLYEASQAEELLKLYRSVPEECSLLQEEILECILRDYVRMDNPAERLAILPKHLNRVLWQLEDSPPQMLAVLNNIVQKAEIYLTMLDVLPRTPDMCVLATSLSGYEAKEWQTLKQHAIAVMGDGCKFCIGLSHWVTVVEYELQCQRLQKDCTSREGALAKAEKKLREQELEIQNLKEELQPTKRAKK